MSRNYRRILSLMVLLGAARALADVDQACWNRDVERIDYLQNPPEGGDNEFFTGVSDTSGNTNVTLIWPSHATLMDFSQRLYRIRVDLGGTSPTGCSNAYRYRNWPSSGSSSGTAESLTTACSNAGGAVQQAACLACLNTRGYWLNPTVTDKDVTTSAGVFTTNYLRFHPVKWVLLSLAYKRLVNGPLLLSLREAVPQAPAPRYSPGPGAPPRHTERMITSASSAAAIRTNPGKQPR